MGSRASRVDVIARRARPGSIVGLRGSRGGEVVLAQRCMMTEGESIRVSPSGAARVSGLSTRLIEGRCSAWRESVIARSHRRRGGLPGARRIVAPSTSLRRRSCAARSETAHSSGTWTHSACTRVSASSPARSMFPHRASRLARGRDHPDLASRSGKRSASSRLRGSPVSSPRLQIPSTKVSGHHVRT